VAEDRHGGSNRSVLKTRIERLPQYHTRYDVERMLASSRILRVEDRVGSRSSGVAWQNPAGVMLLTGATANLLVVAERI
jgi:hypothetical protein